MVIIEREYKAHKYAKIKEKGEEMKPRWDKK